MIDYNKAWVNYYYDENKFNYRDGFELAKIKCGHDGYLHPMLDVGQGTGWSWLTV